MQKIKWKGTHRSQTVLPTLCRTFWLNFLANPEEKFVPPEFGLKKNTFFACVSRKIKTFLGHFTRIREDKRRETILLKFGPFSSLFVQKLAKFCCRIVCPLHLLFGFLLMRLNNWPVGNTDLKLEAEASSQKTVLRSNIMKK